MIRAEDLAAAVGKLAADGIDVTVRLGRQQAPGSPTPSTALVADVAASTRSRPDTWCTVFRALHRVDPAPTKVINLPAAVS